MMQRGTIWPVFKLCFLLWHAAIVQGFAQQTVFSMMKGDNRRAADLMSSGKYRDAVEVYESMAGRTADPQYYLEIARVYTKLNEPAASVLWYRKYTDLGKDLPAADLLAYAESLATQGDYNNAIKYFTQYELASGNDPRVMKKIWQIRNRRYLFEDSVHYTIKELDCNSVSADMTAVPYESGFVFLSNRPRRTVIKNLDGSNNPFFRWYQSSLKTDSTGIFTHYGDAVPFFDKLDAKWQLGPVSFFDNENKLAFIASALQLPPHGKRTLQVFFAERGVDGWKMSGAFPFNSEKFSISSVSVSNDGKVMYFSSDMPGGAGGADLYQSRFDGAWSKPLNLGNAVNTAGDESFPFISDNALYFASNGLAGLGGLDVFSVSVAGDQFGEPQNLGYPVNTSSDDFALALNAARTKGFLSSNRKHTDDVFEVTIDLQTYPFTIAGILKYKEENWRTSDELKTYPHAELELIDNLRGTVVGKTTSDALGHFDLTIPHFSQYRIRVTGPDAGDEAMVSLDLGKTRYGENKFELVVVKNDFRKE